MVKNLVLVLGVAFCIPAVAQKAEKSFRQSLDDSTLQQQGPYTLMPFNRMISSAGKVVTFGDPAQENHTMDFSVMPDGKHIAIEDRYGVAVLDVASGSIVHRWTFLGTASTRGLMSTYSGIKSFLWEGKTYMVWGAGSTRQSAV